MNICKAISAGLLSSVVFVGQGALAQSQAEGDASLCTDGVLKRLGKHFRLADFAYPRRGMYPGAENGGLLVAGICKQWPDNTSRIIAAFAYDGGVEGEKQLLLAIVEVPSHRVVASYKGVIPEDAATEVSSASLSLDTARYTLSRNTRAFGLGLQTFRDRCGYGGGFDNQLTLFVVDGKAIRPVFSETMSHWRYGAGNRCGGEDIARTDATTVIAVEPTTSHGFADLRLTAMRSDKRTRVSAIVRYNGEHYDLKPWSTAFGAWWD